MVKIEAFNVTAYPGKIPLIDGFTGKDFTGDNDVVLHSATSFNKEAPGALPKPDGCEVPADAVGRTD